MLADGQAELEENRRRLEADRLDAQQRTAAERQAAAAAQARIEADWEKRSHVIKSRAEHLERRAAALDQLRVEVLRTQRETLELRLATDELWAQMIGAAPPAALSQSLARIRGQLAEQYQAERAEIAGRQQGLEMAAARLDEQRQRLAQQKHELEKWAADRQADVAGQAARLAAREQQLDRQQAEWERLRWQHATDRRAYEQEIRRLLGQLRRESGPDSAPRAA